MERLRREEEGAASAGREREQLGQTVRSLEQELAEKQDELLTAQVRCSWIIARDVRTGPMMWNYGEQNLPK